jgi:hypothetical protein
MSLVTPIRLFSPFIVTIYFGWEIGYNYQPIKMFGILVMIISIFTFMYHKKVEYNAQVR